MKFIDLVKYFRNGGTYETFCRENGLNVEAEVIEIYTKKPFSIDNELAFFAIEDTDGLIEYSYNGEMYYNLWDLLYFQEAIEESKTGEHKSTSDEKLAQLLYNYALYDA